MLQYKNMIIVGLGNPGEKYKNTRHNIGFMAIDKFAEKNNFPEFKLNKKATALVSEQNDTILVKPQTFMNDSGKAVQKIAKCCKLKAESLIVIHDDIDLKIGKIKIVKDRGSAGHKGVESVIKSIGKKGLVRFRIGIAPQDDVKAEKIVLKKISKEERKILEKTIEKIAEALDLFIKKGLDKTMNEYNK